MIPIKIITREEAKRLGLTEDKGSGGRTAILVGGVVEGKIGEKGTMVERTVFHEGNHELIFMDEKRKKQLNDKGQLADYLNQFHKIEGMDKEEYFKKYNLKPKDLKKDIPSEE